MKLRRLAPILPIVLLTLGVPSAIARPAHPDPIAAIEEEARALLHIQLVLGWYTTTRGEPAIFAETYRGHEQLFSKATIAQVGHRLAAPGLSADERLRLRFLRDYLATEYVNQAVAHFGDEEENAELTSRAPLSFTKEPVPYKQLDGLESNDPEPAHRAEIEREKQRIRAETLNPILAAKEREAERLAKQIGFRDYLELSTNFRLVDPRALLAKGAAYKAHGEATYRALLGERAKRALDKEVADLHASDLGRLFKMPEDDRFFPKELTLPTFEYFLHGIGLSLTGATGHAIAVDDEPRPEKDPRAVTFAVQTPDDIRFSIKPIGGIEDFVTAFHEGGHAEHFANATTPLWALRDLGNNGVTESYAEFFAHSWDDPVWLRHYRDFVAAWDKDHGTHYPLMSDPEIVTFVRGRVFFRMMMLRRYAWAKLIYEPILHGSGARVAGLWVGRTTDPPQEIYRELFSEAYGIRMTPAEALRYLTDVDDFLYAADYARAFVLADMMQESMRARFGEDWYESPKVGELLRSELFARGNALQPDEVARLLGYPQGLDFTVVEARQARLLGAPLLPVGAVAPVSLAPASSGPASSTSAH